MADKQNTPCKGCEDRVPGCHGGCDKFKAFREDLDRRKQERLDVINRESIVEDFIKKRRR